MTAAWREDNETMRVALRVLLVAVSVHFLWEMAQAHAFIGLPPDAFWATVACARASVGDGLLTLLIWGAGALGFAQASWIRTQGWQGWGALIGLAAAVAVGTEMIMVYGLGRWGYGASMPLLPILQVGLWPVLQMVVLTPLVLSLACRPQAHTVAR